MAPAGMHGEGEHALARSSRNIFSTSICSFAWYYILFSTISTSSLRIFKQFCSFCRIARVSGPGGLCMSPKDAAHRPLRSHAPGQALGVAPPLLCSRVRTSFAICWRLYAGTHSLQQAAQPRTFRLLLLQLPYRNCSSSSASRRLISSAACPSWYLHHEQIFFEQHLFPPFLPQQGRPRSPAPRRRSTRTTAPVPLTTLSLFKMLIFCPHLWVGRFVVLGCGGVYTPPHPNTTKR